MIDTSIDCPEIPSNHRRLISCKIRRNVPFRGVRRIHFQDRDRNPNSTVTYDCFRHGVKNVTECPLYNHPHVSRRFLGPPLPRRHLARIPQHS